MDDFGLALKVGLVTLVVLALVGWVWGLAFLVLGLAALLVAGIGALVLRIIR